MMKSSTNRKLLSKFINAASTNTGRVHIIPSQSVWLVKKEGSKRSSAIRPTIEAAVKTAKSMKFSSNIIIHKKDGTITVEKR